LATGQRGKQKKLIILLYFGDMLDLVSDMMLEDKFSSQSGEFGITFHKNPLYRLHKNQWLPTVFFTSVLQSLQCLLPVFWFALFCCTSLDQKEW